MTRKVFDAVLAAVVLGLALVGWLTADEEDVPW